MFLFQVNKIYTNEPYEPYYHEPILHKDRVILDQDGYIKPKNF